MFKTPLPSVSPPACSPRVPLTQPHCHLPVIQLDFNDAAGNQSLVNRGSLGGNGTSTGSFSFATDAGAPPNGPDSDAGTFSSGSDGVDFGDVGAFDGLSAFTITAWINPASSPSNTVRIVSNQDNTNGDREGIELGFH